MLVHFHSSTIVLTAELSMQKTTDFSILENVLHAYIVTTGDIFNFSEENIDVLLKLVSCKESFPATLTSMLETETLSNYQMKSDCVFMKFKQQAGCH